MNRKTVGLVLCILLLAVSMISAGCARTPKPVSPTFAETESVTVEVVEVDEPAYEPAEEVDPMVGEGMGEGFEEGELAINQDQLVRDKVFAEAKEVLKPVYFDYDKSSLKAEAKAQLEKAAEWLKANRSVNCQIEGHCDERGTNEYNLALGERRALSARRYLVVLGINPDRLFTISYGEERPAVEGHDESAWKFNRRAEFGISD